MVFNIYNCFPYIILGYLFIILGIIGKFGLYPANLGILGIIDGISLFSTILILILNKYVYLIILGLNIFPPISCGVVAKSICVSLLVLLSLVTIYHGISLNLKNFTLRKFITGSSMINVGLLLIIFINRDLSLTYIILIFYLLFYVIISLGLFGILLLWKNKSSNIILNDVNVEIIYNPVVYCIFILYLIAISGFPVFILFFNKIYINCLLAQDNGLAIVMELIIITLLAGNYKYLRIIYYVTSEYYYKLLIDNCNGIRYMGVTYYPPNANIEYWNMFGGLVLNKDKDYKELSYVLLLYPLIINFLLTVSAYSAFWHLVTHKK